MWNNESRQKSIESKQRACFSDVFKKKSCAPNAQVIRYLIKYFGKEYKCDKCSLLKWQDMDIGLELHHLDGDSSNNEVSNLQFLCPNCHSQTETHKGKNINTGLVKVSDQGLIDAYLETGNIRRALLKVGLAAKGGNYTRVYRVLAKYEIKLPITAP
jgi:Zn finger protein HypA/HybF involved in hydrogenase expression